MMLPLGLGLEIEICELTDGSEAFSNCGLLLTSVPVWIPIDFGVVVVLAQIDWLNVTDFGQEFGQVQTTQICMVHALIHVRIVSTYLK